MKDNSLIISVTYDSNSDAGGGFRAGAASLRRFAPSADGGEGIPQARPARFRSGHPPLPRPDGRATSRRGALPPPGGPVTLRFEGIAAVFRVESGPLAGKSLNTGPPPPLGATPSLRRRAGVALRTGSGALCYRYMSIPIFRGDRLGTADPSSTPAPVGRMQVTNGANRHHSRPHSEAPSRHQWRNMSESRHSQRA